MGDLARKRSARDLWVSRSHLWAMGTGTFVLAATAFVVGFTVGRDHMPEAVIQADDAESEPALVELLARVEASSRPHGGVDELTFPDQLDHVPVPPVDPTLVVEGAVAVPVDIPVAEAPAVEPSVVPAGPAPDMPVEAPPAGNVTIEIARFEAGGAALALRNQLVEAGLPAWVAIELQSGRMVHRVSVGGYADEEAGAAALIDVVPQLRGMGIPSAPVVVPLQ